MISNTSIQAFLTDKGMYSGKIDGILGPKTHQAVIGVLAEARITEWAIWKEPQRLVALQQLMMLEAGVSRSEVGTIDGHVGPMFRNAFEAWQDLQRIDALWMPTRNPSKRWPLQSDVEKVFGKPGMNLTTMRLPYPMYTAWNGDLIQRIQLHKEVAESAEKALLAVRDAYRSEAQRTALGLDKYSGGFIIRPMKSSTRLSMHAYGLALDFDDEHNQYRWTHAQARFAQPEYAAWWKAWEDEGWISLGRERDFDWMHIQAARLA